ncbi:hypothetical protein [Streptococcus gallinaceus]|uniref:Uncharacterized protein n=1 Tax=Streptococcus gallinaceus TaxID=165758 RepID=A0ABV2JLJ1_9STRE|nr:hypothetical protein [Streptococcus gallinaceus]MCP1639590.1 hypothetical protein [Streptococcus gallinaceus]MCP1770373.1 hypothetical protein [Streptococcus gallinaceus]
MKNGLNKLVELGFSYRIVKLKIILGNYYIKSTEKQIVEKKYQKIDTKSVE